MSWSEVVLLLLTAIVSVLFVRAIVVSSATRGRKRGLLAWATANQLSFSAEPDYGIADDHPTFNRLSWGANSFADNIMEGKQRGRALQAFDYHSFAASEPDDDHDLRDQFVEFIIYALFSRGVGRGFSAIILESSVPLKPLSIRAESASGDLAEFLGFEEIKFESAEFNREFHVRSPDRKWAYDVLHPRAMEYLLSMPRFEIQFDEKAVLVHGASIFSARDFEAAAQVAQRLLDGLPEYVVEQQTLA
jgi:hypothetical protein